MWSENKRIIKCFIVELTGQGVVGVALGGKEHVLVTSSEKKTRENWIQEVGGILEGKICYLASWLGSVITCITY